MINTELVLPVREEKPRENGWTILIDNGAPIQHFKDTIHSSSEYIDLVKFGWGTSLVSKYLKQKIDCLRKEGIEFFFGGTLFEKFLSQGKVDEFYHLCKQFDCSYVEISNGTIDIPNRKKAEFIADFADEFAVVGEVGAKDSLNSEQQSSAEWLENIHEDLEAGATKVITEARESGTSGICQADGAIRIDIFNQIIASGIPMERLVFEAPNKQMQTFFIQNVGSDVNLANIALSDAIALETLRLGLRSDTFNL
ncbi:phosphosulfolactate synthase [Sediminibacillus albus]|uniref:Phosphosulfolactate synthase n=1 Tax=Sediminibacillus albus TaxID=407036 RepID=A0A1G8X3J2_9BACI|nr:phosphosulfolactate synthase [Sediminibacillus albus]SDJ84876.1 phosphosulfolactate synthase [Sediminibacillus albus]